MALIVADSFDLYSNKADAINGGWVSEHALNLTFSTSNGRFGGGCLQTSGGTLGWVQGVNLAANSTVIICCAVHPTLTGVVGDAQLMIGLNCTAEQCFSLRYTSGGDLKAFNGASTPIQVGSTASAALSNGAWHWLEVKVVPGSTDSNGSIIVRVNDVEVINVGSIDTRAANGDGIEAVRFAGSGAACRWDDVIIMDGTGSYMNDFLSDSRIDARTPNGDSSPSNWTASTGADWQCVDDGIAGSNDDTDYVSSSTAGNISEFNIADISDNPGTIHGVQVRTRSRKEDAGNRTYRTYVKSGASTENGTTIGPTFGYAWRHNGVCYRNPDGATAWTKAAVNAMKVGLEVVS